MLRPRPLRRGRLWGWGVLRPEVPSYFGPARRGLDAGPLERISNLTRAPPGAPLKQPGGGALSGPERRRFKQGSPLTQRQ